MALLDRFLVENAVLYESLVHRFHAGEPMQLWILRHAKARHALPDEWDRDRPLTETGHGDADRLNAWLKDAGHPLPDQVVVSPAIRTRQTAERVLKDLDLPPPVFDERLWEATGEDLLEILDERGNGDTRLMLVGHNPGLEWLVQFVSGQRLTLGLQPGGLVILDCLLPTSAGSGRIVSLVQPNDLM
jgi:phosphohistidine phosphatase